MITPTKFARLFPACAPKVRERYRLALVAAMLEAKITTRKRAAGFFAQLGHESHDFRFMQEIASGAAYEGRRDLGNVREGDGRRFKGRGPIQITGRFNYTRAGIALGLPLHERPELLEIPENGFRASAWFWNSNKLNIYADALLGTGSAEDFKRFDKITKRVNGGYNGKADRDARYRRALAVLTDADFTGDVTEPAGSAPAAVAPSADPAAIPSAQTSEPAGSVEQPTPAPIPAPPASSSPAASESLLDELEITPETKATAAPLVRRLGVRAGGVVVAMWTSGLTGRVLVVAVVVGLLALVYFERKRIKPALVKLARKVFKK